MPTTTVIGFMGFLGAKSGPLPPKRPLELSLWIGQYAQSLFYVEASKYPPLDPNFCHWLTRLAIRLEERVMRIIGEIEKASLFNSLTYHGLAGEQIRKVARKALHQKMQEWPQFKGAIIEVKPPKNPRDAEPKSESLATALEGDPIPERNLSEELAHLLTDARWKPEDIAEKVGIDPRNVYRHLASDTVPTITNIGNYEAALSKRLGRIVTLPTPAKRQRASKTPAKRQ